ncbi:peptidyl-prolyl cis-trans isomerase [Saccharospirillum salsuginis]|uniref:PpiC domain-containing protein n=1 Tax=Saccharospirillum salsuginis TaxID=418750 RepID=A0A918KBI4_9GAMM|nr:peptidylprolyl isomerase [Saccharospirillum salsuginis]GGX56082.1 hypothetical protein GCM10007392_24840 [Saccharospirillum salsuginis]
MYRWSRWAGIWIAAGVLLTACSDKEPATATEPTVDESAEKVVEGWATVNDSVLTDDEFEAAVDRFFGDQIVDARALRNIRESLITSRALSQHAEQSLDADTLRSIELATQAYREEKLIAAYLDQVTTPEPVSAQAVKAYYENHLEDFGAASVKRLEVLRINFEEQGQQAAEAARLLGRVDERDDWATWSQKQADGSVRHMRVAANDQLSARLRAAIKPLGTDQVTGVIVEGDTAYRIRVLGVDRIPPKPLGEVSADIRRRLAANQLKQAISEVSEDVLSDSTIERRYD